MYSNWLTENLVDPGLMPASQLNQYEDITFAVRDLRDGRIDLVVLDQPPAQVAVNQGGVRIAGQSLNVQYFAIGLPQGEPTLQSQINGALGQMVADGTLGELVQEYIGVTPLPLPTAVPTALPTVPPTLPTAIPQFTPTPAPCVDGMTFVADLNLDDRNMTAPPIMNPGQPFRKGWRIRNTGTCTWDSRYVLHPDGGNSPAASMGGRPTPVLGLVPPGQRVRYLCRSGRALYPRHLSGFLGDAQPGQSEVRQSHLGRHSRAQPADGDAAAHANAFAGD